MDSKEALDQYERVEEAQVERLEKVEVAEERREGFGRRVAFLVAVIAALLGIATLLGQRASDEMLLAQAKASDAYNEYQANSLKSHINLNDVSILRSLGSSTPGAAAIANALEASNAKYVSQKALLLPRAQAYAAEQVAAERRHNLLQISEGALQLGIVLASVSIIARARWLAIGAGGLGAIGALFLLAGMAGLGG